MALHDMEVKILQEELDRIKNAQEKFGTEADQDREAWKAKFHDAEVDRVELDILRAKESAWSNEKVTD